MLVSAQAIHGSLVTGVAQSTKDEVANQLCIIGDGAPSLALGCMLSASGHSARVWIEQDDFAAASGNKWPSEYEIRKRRAAVSSFRGKTGFTGLDYDLAAAIKGADGIIVSARATEYGVLIGRMSPYLSNGQTVCLMDAPLGAALEFERKLAAQKSDLQLNVLEMGSLFDSARVEGNVLLITGQREKVSICGNSRNATRRGLSVASNISSGLVPTSNVFERGLSDAEKILLPVLLLFAVFESKGARLEQISRSVTPAVTSLISAMEAEVQILARNFKCVIPSFVQALADFGAASESTDMREALINVAQNFADQTYGHPLPLETAIAVVKEDVAETLALLSDMARLARISMPVLNSVVELASAVTQCDLTRHGRTLQDLGLVGFDVAEIVELINS